MTQALLSDLLKGDSDFTQDNFTNYNKIEEENKELNNEGDGEIKDNNQQNNITYIEQERIDKVAETLNSLDNNEDKIKVINKLKGRMQKPKQIYMLNKLEKTLYNLNKIKELKKKLKKKPINENDVGIEAKGVFPEKMNEKDLNELLKEFKGDLFKDSKEEERPKTRAEKREIEKENEEKLKNVAKTINGLNKDDQKIIIEKLRTDSNNNEKNKEEFDKLNNLLINTNNLKSYINKLVKEKIYEDKNKKIEKENNIIEKQNELNNEDFKELNNNIEENLFPENKDIENETKISDKHLVKVEDGKINKAVDIIKELNPVQQKQILENLKTKALENKNIPKYKKIIQKVKDINKLNNIIKVLSQKKDEKVIKNNEKENEEGEPKEKELNEDEFVNLAENILNTLFDEENQLSQINQVEKYVNEKEKEEKIDKILNVINKMNNEDKKKMVKLLNDNADTTSKKNNFKF